MCILNVVNCLSLVFLYVIPYKNFFLVCQDRQLIKHLNQLGAASKSTMGKMIKT